MRALKWFLIILILFLLVTASGFYLVISGITPINLTVTNDSFIARQIRKRSGFAIQFDGAMDVKISNKFVIDTGKVTIAGATDEAPLFQINRFHAEGILDYSIFSGQVPTVKELEIETLRINLARDADGQFMLPNRMHLALNQLHQITPDTIPHNHLGLIATAVAQEKPKSILLTLPLHNIKISDVVINIKDIDQDILLVMENINFVLPKGAVEGAIDLHGTINAAPMEVDVDISPLGTLVGSVDVAGVVISLEGAVSPTIDLKTSFDIRNTAVLAKLMGVALPSGPFQGEIDITFDERNLLQANVKRILASNSVFEGFFTLSIAGRAVVLDLEGERMAMADFMPVASEDSPVDTSARIAGDSKQIIPDMPAPSFLLRQNFMPEFSDARININIGRLDIYNFLIDDVLANVVAEDDHITVTVENMQVGLGGSISGSTNVHAGGNGRIDAALEFTKVPISTIQRYVPQSSEWNGEVSGSVNIQTEGKTLPDMAARLRGSLSANMGEGYYRLPPEAVKTLQTISPTILQDNLLLIECLDVRANFDHGLSKDAAMVLQSRAMSTRGAGVVSLADETMDINILNTMEVLGMFLGLPLSVKGTFATPQYQADMAGLLSGQIESPVPAVDPEQSECHARVAATTPKSFDSLPKSFSLDNAGNLLGLSGQIQKQLNTLQQKLDEKLSDDAKQLDNLLNSERPFETVKDAVDKVIEQAVNHETEEQLLQNAQEAVQNAKEAGQSLLRSLLGD